MDNKILVELIKVLESEVKAPGTSFSIYEGNIIIFYGANNKVGLHWRLLKSINDICDIIGIESYERTEEKYIKKQNYLEDCITTYKNGYRIILKRDIEIRLKNKVK